MPKRCRAPTVFISWLTLSEKKTYKTMTLKRQHRADPPTDVFWVIYPKCDVKSHNRLLHRFTLFLTLSPLFLPRFLHAAVIL